MIVPCEMNWLKAETSHKCAEALKISASEILFSFVRILLRTQTLSISIQASCNSELLFLYGGDKWRQTCRRKKAIMAVTKCLLGCELNNSAYKTEVWEDHKRTEPVHVAHTASQPQLRTLHGNWQQLDCQILNILDTYF